MDIAENFCDVWKTGSRCSWVAYVCE